MPKVNVVEDGPVKEIDVTVHATITVKEAVMSLSGYSVTLTSSDKL